MNQCLLIIFAVPAIEESLVDWLLENIVISGFSTMHGFGHGTRHSGLTLLEQVTGRQHRTQFIIEISHAASAVLISDLRNKFSGAGLHYMLMPLMEAGKL
ncbi:MAG TPA: DUF3240 family protein [Novimethylophilus sp.]|jgi:hypothetical protein|uniref:DUF3240 family protein n=1 Tax=Novimethylophilus sp. TaxID=2137426 RepID=UPI002F3F9F33